MKRLLTLSLLLITVLTAMAKDIRTVVLTTQPQMHCHNCENKVTENLRYVRGVKTIKALAADQTITITYDADKTTVDAFVKSLKKIGYEATVKQAPTAKTSTAKDKAPKKTDATTGATTQQH